VAIERVEVITSVERRRRWATEDTLKLVAESYTAAFSVGDPKGTGRGWKLTTAR
jgi:hypothetical protein